MSRLESLIAAAAVLLSGCGEGLYFDEMTPMHFRYAESLCEANGGIEAAGGKTHSSTGEMLVWARCNNGAVFNTRPISKDPKK